VITLRLAPYLESRPVANNKSLSRVQALAEWIRRDKIMLARVDVADRSGSSKLFLTPCVSPDVEVPSHLG
jgi:hypothetical protein